MFDVADPPSLTQKGSVMISCKAIWLTRYW